jgi:hypothetical protein
LQLLKLSDYFSKNFNHQWVSLQVNNQKLIRAINRHRKTLNEYAMQGFLNLPKELVEAMLRSGLSWGGQWRSTKDFMHFELPNP